MAYMTRRAISTYGNGVVNARFPTNEEMRYSNFVTTL